MKPACLSGQQEQGGPGQGGLLGDGGQGLHQQGCGLRGHARRFHFLKGHRVREIPDDICHINKETTQQACFYCLVDNCDRKSLRPLRYLVPGNKHVRKACEKNQQIIGLLRAPLEGSGWRWGTAGQQEEELVCILRVWWPSCTRGRLDFRGRGCGEVIIEEEEYGFMVTNFWVNGNLWRGDQTTSEITNSSL